MSIFLSLLGRGRLLSRAHGVKLLSRSLGTGGGGSRRERGSAPPAPQKRSKPAPAPVPVAGAAAGAEDEDEEEVPAADSKDLRAGLARQVEVCRRELAKLRGATASASMLDSVLVEAYGERQALSAVAQVALRGPQLLVVSPFDAALAPAIADAIRAVEELNLNPSVDGNAVRVPVPRSNKETREATARLASKAAEAAKVRVRRLRQAALDRLKKQEGASEDDVRRETKAVDEQVAAAVQDIAKLAEKKRLEIEAQ